MAVYNIMDSDHAWDFEYKLIEPLHLPPLKDDEYPSEIIQSLTPEEYLKCFKYHIDVVKDLRELMILIYYLIYHGLTYDINKLDKIIDQWVQYMDSDNLSIWFIAKECKKYLKQPEQGIKVQFGKFKSDKEVYKLLILFLFERYGIEVIKHKEIHNANNKALLLTLDKKHDLTNLPCSLGWFNEFRIYYLN
jgi:hypothetical protein